MVAEKPLRSVLRTRLDRRFGPPMLRHLDRRRGRPSPVEELVARNCNRAVIPPSQSDTFRMQKRTSGASWQPSIERDPARRFAMATGQSAHGGEDK